jgi:hypothetical protein
LPCFVSDPPPPVRKCGTITTSRAHASNETMEVHGLV